MPRVTPGPPCLICKNPSHARGLCSTHYNRWREHGHTGQTRPKGWGSRSAHPLKDTWVNTGKHLVGRDARWNDFWLFVEDVGERPHRLSRLKRRDASQPWGPSNAFWTTPITKDGARVDKAAYQREYARQNPLRIKSIDMKRRYGLTLEDYDRMLEAQDGKCAICGEFDETFGRLVIDHCHDRKKVRGLLCSICNRALGGFRDSPELLSRAVAYLNLTK